jgi:hypothetical protein
VGEEKFVTELNRAFSAGLLARFTSSLGSVPGLVNKE